MAAVIEYDLVVIGSGPGGQKAAVAAAKLGKSVAVIERGRMGGVCVNTGTIPSKSMREAVVYLTGLNQRETLRRQLPRQGQDHVGGPACPNRACHQQRKRCDPLTAHA
jgi:pyruvate/2-oxoglutarate dehydrogenase complex dihydrolipoamide dehydrogenase (E3) component